MLVNVWLVLLEDIRHCIT